LLRARRWCFLGPLRARAGSMAHHAALCTRVMLFRSSTEGAQEKRRERGDGGRDERGRSRAVGGKATGAWVM
jgi:hypothetical protein